METKHMTFRKNTEKKTSKVLLRENKRLKCENQRLRESIEELQRYKDEYKNLIGELSSIKESYVDKIDEFNKIENKYRAELARVKKKA